MRAILNVGQWVRVLGSGKIFQVKDVFRDGYTNYITSQKLTPRTKWDSGLYNGQYAVEDIELWKPKIGEWCWNDHILVKVESINTANNRADNLPIYSVSVPMMAESWSGAMTLEPFIGEYPLFIKELYGVE